MELKTASRLRVTTTVVALIATIFAVPVAAAPSGAMAATDIAASPCSSGWLCLYQDVSFGGLKYEFSGKSCFNLSLIGFNDKTSSYKNKSTQTVYLFADGDCRGASIPVTPGAEAPSMGAGWNDRVSSIR
jgi:hypothetical protein